MILIECRGCRKLFIPCCAHKRQDLTWHSFVKYNFKHINCTSEYAYAGTTSSERTYSTVKNVRAKIENAIDGPVKRLTYLHREYIFFEPCPHFEEIKRYIAEHIDAEKAKRLRVKL